MLASTPPRGRSPLTNPRLPWVAGAAALGLPTWYALLVSVVVSPEALERGDAVVAPSCWLRALLGAPCPTCGLTRAFAALGHGDVERALALHRAAPAVYAVYWIVGVAAAIVLTTQLARWNHTPLGGQDKTHATS